MKNISPVTRNLYYVSLFNTKSFKNFNKISSIFIACSLRQDNFNKTNLYNFIFLLYWLSGNKPVLQIAKESNAMLKIRKGSLLRFIINLSDLKKMNLFIKNFSWLFDNKLKLNQVHSRKNFIKNNLQSIPLEVEINPSSYEKSQMLFVHNFLISLVIHLKVFCIKKQKFALSLF